MQHAVHSQIKVLRTLISKYKKLGEFDYITDKIAERQLKTLERMRTEWEKQEREECRKGPAPKKTLAPSVDNKQLSACSARFTACVGKHTHTDCMHQRKVCEAKLLGLKT